MNRGVFRDNRGINAIIAGCISLFVLLGLNNYTDYFSSFSEMFSNMELSAQGILFIILGVLVLILLWRGLKKQASSRELPFITTALAILSFLAYFSPSFINNYYLPDWFEDYRLTFLIAGIALAVLAVIIFYAKKKKFFAVKMMK